MKVVFLTNILAPYRLPYFEALDKLVDELTIVSMAEKHEDREWLIDDYDFSCLTLKGIHFRPPGHDVSLHLNYGTISRLKQLNPDVVVSGGFGPANIAGYIYCKLFRKKYVGWGELSFFDGADRSPVKRLIRRVLSKGSQATLASSSRSLEAFEYYGAPKNKSLVTVMPFDFRGFCERAAFFRGSGVTKVVHEHKPVLIAISRLVPEKGIHLLLEMFARVKRAYPHAELKIAGDGSDRQRLESMVHEMGLEDVKFLGFLQESELIKTMVESDVFVFPTLQDPFGAVLVEAMACRLPVVTSIHAYATRDLVEDGVSGFVIDPEDIENSSNKIIRCLAMTEIQRNEMTELGFESAKQADAIQAAHDTAHFLKKVVNG